VSIDYHTNPERFIGKGAVWLAWDEDRRGYVGYWDLEPDGQPTPLEKSPETSSLEDLLAWGRERAKRLFVRPELDPHVYYWAGEGPIPQGAAQEGVKRLDIS
jgi:hypothetical protein